MRLGHAGRVAGRAAGARLLLRGPALPACHVAAASRQAGGEPAPAPAAAAARRGRGRFDRRGSQAADASVPAFVPEGAGAGVTGAAGVGENAGDGGGEGDGGRRAKRKVALVFAYRGADYLGSQFNKDTAAGRTVEEEVMAAVYKAGGIDPRNHLRPGKLAWARSSRTDKGVHALQNVVSFKMLVASPDRAWSGDREGIALARSINRHLPPSVRVLSVQRVQKAFLARQHTVSRHYQYFVPTAVLAPGGGPGETREAVARFRAALSAYEGLRSFHNFTRRSLYRASAAGGGGLGAPAGEETVPDRVEWAFGGRKAASAKVSAFWWNREVDAADAVTPAMRRRILSARCSDPRPLGEGAADAVCVELHGQSFIFNQIRYMMGAAICVARGVVPLDFLRCALSPPARVRFPLAPAEGLLLSGNEFALYQPEEKASPKLPRLEVGERAAAAQAAFWEDVLRTDLAGSVGAGGPWDEFEESLESDYSDMYVEGNVSQIVQEWRSWYTEYLAKEAKEEAAKMKRL